jgi:hypothetical protein
MKTSFAENTDSLLQLAYIWWCVSPLFLSLPVRSFSFACRHIDYLKMVFQDNDISSTWSVAYCSWYIFLLLSPSAFSAAQEPTTLSLTIRSRPNQEAKKFVQYSE